MPATDNREPLHAGGGSFCLIPNPIDSMKTLSEKACKTLSALLAMEQPITDSSGNRIEARVANTIGQYRAITVTLWKDDEGFQTKEPELTIFHDTQTDEYFPASMVYQKEQIVSNSITLVYGEFTLLNEQIQSDHADFANRWLGEIAEEQSISI